MAILSDRDLRERMSRPLTTFDGRPSERLIVEPLAGEEAIQPASIDLRIGYELKLRADGEYRDAVRDEDGTWWLSPGSFYLASTIEVVRLPHDLVGMVAGRSTIGRRGLIVEMAGWIDPGWHGQVTLELYNASSDYHQLKPGSGIAQLVVMELSSPALRPYGSPGLGSKYEGAGVEGPR